MDGVINNVSCVKEINCVGRLFQSGLYSLKIITPFLGLAKSRTPTLVIAVTLLVSLTGESAIAQSTVDPASGTAVETSESEESALARLAAAADKPKKEKVRRSRPIQAQKPQDRTSSETMTSVHKE